LCILSAVFQLRALMYVLCAFVILNKDYLLTYLLNRKHYYVGSRTHWSVAETVGDISFCRHWGDN